ncbi:hypothetical protein [Pandoravirus japonicus]|uniref:F-box domain-containing protein n=1 Tax=Pandoravirus japonicus TaxID=2823154 RepID=A0A811BNP0_9VIRU|nr:hypothetical protein [Pandoravirus japonicus]
MLGQLPDDVIGIIILLLDFQSLMCCRALCRAIRDVWLSPLLWRARLRRITHYCSSCPLIAGPPGLPQAAILAETEIAVRREEDAATDALVHAINQRVPPAFAATRAGGRRRITVLPFDRTEMGGEPVVKPQPGDHVLFYDGGKVRHAIVASEWSQTRRSQDDQVATWTVKPQEDGTTDSGLRFKSVQAWMRSNRNATLFRVIYDDSAIAPAESNALVTALLVPLVRGGRINSDLWDDFAYTFYCRTRTVLPPTVRQRGLETITRHVQEATPTWFTLH